MAINQVVLNGNLTKDIELKYSASGVAIARFTLAVGRSFKSASGERESDFIQCIAFKQTAEALSNYTSKGSKIGVTGRIQTGSYEGQDGKRVYTTDVMVNEFEFLDKKQGGQQQTQQNSAPLEVESEELPF